MYIDGTQKCDSFEWNFSNALYIIHFFSPIIEFFSDCLPKSIQKYTRMRFKSKIKTSLYKIQFLTQKFRAGIFLTKHTK